MKRIYFMLPGIEITKKIVDEMLVERVDEKHIHVLAKRGTKLENLPEAGYMQKTDFMPALEQGVALGGVTGMIAGLVAVALPGGPVLAGGAILATSLAGAGVGAWLSSMVGSSIGNRQLTQFTDAIEKGEILMMVDVPMNRVEEIESIVLKHHPEAKCEGTEPTIPPFP